VICQGCEKDQDDGEFYWIDRDKRILRSKNCKTCRSEYNQDWYSRNKVKHMADVARNSARATEERREVIRRAKEKPCADCGLSYPFYVMDFDHVRGTKVRSISQMINGHKYSIARLLAEIAKCDVVCSNCHRERTFSRLGLTDKALAS
jgi:hypothetical protein